MRGGWRQVGGSARRAGSGRLVVLHEHHVIVVSAVSSGGGGSGSSRWRGIGERAWQEQGVEAEEGKYFQGELGGARGRINAISRTGNEVTRAF